MQLFYTPHIQKDLAILPKEEAQHCIKVLRMQTGDSLCMIDGKGGLYYGTLENANIKNCVVRINKKIENYGKRDYYVHLAVAPTKNISRYEWFVEKATELGVDEITPLLCERSERKVIKTERLNKVILSAVKQSVKAYVPKLNELAKFSNFVKNSTIKNKFIAHCEDSPKQALQSIVKPQTDVLVMIGAEGDFSPNEIELAEKHNFIPVHLGKSRLRTETAGVVACHIVNLAN